VAELVYAYGSEPYPARVGGSSPLICTKNSTRRGGEIGIHAALRWLCLKKRAGSSPVLGTNMGVHKLDTKLYFGQKAFVEKAGKVLVLRDPLALVGTQSGIDFPGGKYRWGETLENALQREVREETGLEIEIGRPLFVWTSKNLKQKTKTVHVVRVGYLCKYKSGTVKLSDEHDAYEWVDKKGYLKWKDKTDDFKALEVYFKLKGA
jgi:8-oxo-dGTP diphosphatase